MPGAGSAPHPADPRLDRYRSGPIQLHMYLSITSIAFYNITLWKPAWAGAELARETLRTWQAATRGLTGIALDELVAAAGEDCGTISRSLVRV